MMIVDLVFRRSCCGTLSFKYKGGSQEKRRRCERRDVADVDQTCALEDFMAVDVERRDDVLCRPSFDGPVYRELRDFPRPLLGQGLRRNKSRQRVLSFFVFNGVSSSYCWEERRGVTVLKADWSSAAHHG